jgi:hypothetical protein
MKGSIVSFVFRLLREDGASSPSVVFEDSANPGLVPVWEAVGVYDALYNSDGRSARDISRTIAFGVDRLVDDPSLARLTHATVSVAEAIRFLENVQRACMLHGAARIETR